MCMCVCEFGGLSIFCIWVEGLCVVVWRGNKWGGVGGGGGGGVEGCGSGFVLFFFYT